MTTSARDYVITSTYTLDEPETLRELARPTTPEEQQIFDSISAEHDADLLPRIMSMINRMSVRPASYATSFYLRKIA